jgi:IS30 family transposase
MERSPSTISREIRRNATHHDGLYRPTKAQQYVGARKHRRTWSKLSEREWMLVVDKLRDGHSPDQISKRFRRDGVLDISHESIYQYVWADRYAGGSLHLCLRQRTRIRRKRYGTKERRGRVAAKRHISERSAAADLRTEFGHWEIDTVHGTGRDAVITLVERKIGLTLLGRIPNLTAAALNKRLVRMIRNFERKHGPSFRTITADNGTEFHSYEKVERATGATFYFATPYHSWERGTNENTNGLLRQYLPKRTSLAGISQLQYNVIAARLNDRPRKRYGYDSPLEQLALAKH